MWWYSLRSPARSVLTFCVASQRRKKTPQLNLATPIPCLDQAVPGPTNESYSIEKCSALALDRIMKRLVPRHRDATGKTGDTVICVFLAVIRHRNLPHRFLGVAYCHIVDEPGDDQRIAVAVLNKLCHGIETMLLRCQAHHGIALALGFALR